MAAQQNNVINFITLIDLDWEDPEYHISILSLPFELEAPASICHLVQGSNIRGFFRLYSIFSTNGLGSTSKQV